MDLYIQNIQQTTSSGRPALSKFYQRLTLDPKITSESNRKDQGKFNTTQVVHLTCHGVHELSHQLLTTWYLSLCDLDHQWSSKISVTVRIGGFKLEGGELFKEGFRKLLSQEWNYLKKQLIKNPVCQITKLKAQHQKNNWLFRRNNRLFIPIYKYQNWI